MKTPEDVCDFLNKQFRDMGINPSVKGFSLFFEENPAFLRMVIDEISIDIFQDWVSENND